MQTFKQPLTKELENQYLKLCNEGNIDARNTLVEYNLRLVAHIIKKYNNFERDLDDLLSIGTIGLIKAIDSYDSSRGNRLATYASRCIENELLMMLRKEKKCSREISLYEPIGTDKEGNEINYFDIAESNNSEILDNIIKEEDISHLQSCIYSELNDREYRIISMRYGLNRYNLSYTQKEVANKLNISRSYVSRIEKRALLKLKRALNSFST